MKYFLRFLGVFSLLFALFVFVNFRKDFGFWPYLLAAFNIAGALLLFWQKKIGILIALLPVIFLFAIMMALASAMSW